MDMEKTRREISKEDVVLNLMERTGVRTLHSFTAGIYRMRRGIKYVRWGGKLFAFHWMDYDSRCAWYHDVSDDLMELE